MMHAHLAEDAAFNKQVNVLIDRRQRDRWDSFLYARIDLFRTRMAMHRLHHFVEHLPLVSHRDAVFLAKLAKRFGLVHQHGKSINDKYYRLVNIVIHRPSLRLSAKPAQRASLFLPKPSNAVEGSL